jgi:putative heme-binding domain-containing protein
MYRPAFALLLLLAVLPSWAVAQRPVQESGEAQWIWRPGPRGPEGAAFFRKVFYIKQPVYGQIDIAADERYELYVNGRRMAAGGDWRVLDRHDIKSLLVSGRNVVAIRAQKRGPQGAAGVVARVVLRNAGGTFVSYSTDASWRCTDKELPQWTSVNLDDATWSGAIALGEFGRTPPWHDNVRTTDGSTPGRFKLPRDFRVERVVAPQQTGSLVAMAFDEWGNIIASREGDHLQLIEDRDNDGRFETVKPLNNKIRNCQGILPLNREVFVVGEGPEGAGLYRLTDEDGDREGVAETVTLLLKFQGGMGEHGPHALTLGPDGWIYLLIGNHAGLHAKPSDNSPYRRFYEGDLVGPKYEDPGGHAVGIKAPGGTVVRLTLDGRHVERVAGGLRNPYDICFNQGGELFTYDSDMEWDEGAPWYRPTRLVHVVPSGEYGWRSGWSKWPSYYHDSLPPLLETGRGSPTGLEVYDHTKFPAEYRGALFLCDWTLGRILCIKTQTAHGTYKAASEVFIEGKPLNVTDLAVGPDGALYFCTGGRGTEGGIYRVVYVGDAGPQPKLAGIGRAVRQPQFNSAYARDKIASVQEEMKQEWDRQLGNLVKDVEAQPSDRVRALELMHLYGPFPTPTLLIQLSKDKQFEVRSKAALLMGQHSSDETKARLVELLADNHPTVRRHACEGLVRSQHEPAVEAVLPLLADKDRFVAWAARRVLDQVPVEKWRDDVLKNSSPRIFNHGASVLLAAEPNKATALAVLSAAERVLGGFLNDGDFVDLLRVVQLALHLGHVPPSEVPASLRKQLAQEYPALTSGNADGGRRINRELVRLLVYLQDETVASRFVEQLRSTEPMEDKMHLAVTSRYLARGWTTERRLEVLDFYEKARAIESGHSVSRYLDNIARDFVASFTAEEQDAVLAKATRWPGAALGALITLPPDPGPNMLKRLQELDGRLDNVPGEPARKLQTGIVAVLARSRDEEGMAYLREVYERDPSRRATLAMGLAQSPGGKNWPLLIRSLPILDGDAAIEVLTQLKLVEGGPPRQPAEPTRYVIVCGLRLKENGANHAIELLQHWYGEQPSKPDDRWDAALKAWQTWYAQRFPDSPPAQLPKTSQPSAWNYDSLLTHLSEPETRGDAANGAAVFVKAQCAKCHRFGRIGEGMGPDLSTVNRRFQKREVLESIIYPSHVVSDQYASKIIQTTDGRQLTGIVGEAGPDALNVLLSTGEQTRIKRAEVERMAPSKVSVMPEGLLNELTLQEITDLFEYLYNPDGLGADRVTRQPRDIGRN